MKLSSQTAHRHGQVMHASNKFTAGDMTAHYVFVLPIKIGLPEESMVSYGFSRLTDRHAEI